MKKIFSLLSIVQLLCMVFTFVACEKSDDDPGKTTDPEAKGALGNYTFVDREVRVDYGYYYVYNNSTIFRLSRQKDAISDDYVQFAIVSKYCDDDEYSFGDMDIFQYTMSCEDGLYSYANYAMSGTFRIKRNANGLYDLQVNGALFPEGPKLVINVKGIPEQTE